MRLSDLVCLKIGLQYYILNITKIDKTQFWFDMKLLLNGAKRYTICMAIYDI